MGVTSLIVGATAAVAGTGTAIYGASQQAKFQAQELEAQKKAEAARHQAMELDARRKQLDVIRTQQRARAMAAANATASGSQFGSGLQGGYGQISGQSNTNALGINQSLELGRDIFQANSDITNARIGEAGAASISSIGSAVTGLGKTFMNDFNQFKAFGQETGFRLF